MTNVPMQPIDFDTSLDALELSDEAFGFIVGRHRAQISLWRYGAEPIPHEIALITLLLAECPDALRLANEHSATLKKGSPSTRDVAERGLGVKLKTPKAH